MSAYTSLLGGSGRRRGGVRVRGPRDIPALIAANPAFAAVLFVGTAVRILTMIAYPPALFFGDSWDYVVSAFSGHPFALSSLRPSGYGWLIRILTLPSRDFAQLVAVQHLAGLVTGTLIYVVLVRARIPRTAAAAAAALVLLDGYAITLEQYVMAETLYTLTVVVAAVIIVWPALDADRHDPRPGIRTVALAGLLLGVGTLQRQTGLFLIPAFVLYLLWIRIGMRRGAAFVVALVVPIVAYAAAFDGRYGSFALTGTSNWNLYGRVAGFADCNGAGIPKAARALCETSAQRHSHPDATDWYVFAEGSPAVNLWGPLGTRTPPGVNSNAILGTFAHKIILHQPFAYLDAVVSDIARYFEPGVTPYADPESATSLPRSASDEDIVKVVRRQYLPTLHPEVRAPAGVVRAYRSAIHVPRPVLLLLALASLLALALRTPARREISLLSGGGLLLIILTSATASFGIRYLVPAVPFIAMGGTLATREVLTAWGITSR